MNTPRRTRPDRGPVRRQLTSNLLLLVGSVVLTGLAIECVARLALRGTLSTQYLQQQVDHTWLGEFTQPSAQAELLYELKPGVDVNSSGIRVMTARDGSRRISPTHPTPPPNPALKIAIIGDSTSFGWAVDYDETYGELLRQRLEERLQRPVELRNFSVPGYNSKQERLCFERSVLPWKPDLAILHYDFNDADPIEGKPLNYMAPTYGDNPLHSIAIKWALRSLQQRRINRAAWVPAEDPQHPTQVYRHYRAAGPLYDQHLRELETIAQEAAGAHIRLIAFIFNTWLERQADFAKDPFYTLLHQPLARALQSYGYAVMDGYPLYQGVMAENNWDNLMLLWVSPRDAHPNPIGHMLIAQALFDYIAANGLVEPSAPARQ